MPKHRKAAPSRSSTKPDSVPPPNGWRRFANRCASPSLSSRIRRPGSRQISVGRRARPAATARNPGCDRESAQTPRRPRRWSAWSCANHGPTQPIPISVAARSRRRGTPHARRRRARPHRRRGRSAAERRRRWVSPVPTTPLAQSLSPSCRRTRRSSRRCSRRRRRFRKERRTTGQSRHRRNSRRGGSTDIATRGEREIVPADGLRRCVEDDAHLVGEIGALLDKLDDARITLLDMGAQRRDMRPQHLGHVRVEGVVGEEVLRARGEDRDLRIQQRGVERRDPVSLDSPATTAGANARRPTVAMGPAIQEAHRRRSGRRRELHRVGRDRPWTRPHDARPRRAPAKASPPWTGR